MGTANVALLLVLVLGFVAVMSAGGLMGWIARWRTEQRIERERLRQEELKTQILEEQLRNEVLRDLHAQPGRGGSAAPLDIPRRDSDPDPAAPEPHPEAQRDRE